MSKRVIAVALVATLAVVVAAGCGGSSRNKAYANDKAAYAAALNGICAKFNADQKAIGNPTSLSDFADKEGQLLVKAKAAVKLMKSLVPPDAIKSNVDHFISTVEQLDAKVSDAIKAAKANDEAKVNQIAGEINSLSKQGDPDANAIGAPACLSTANG